MKWPWSKGNGKAAKASAAEAEYEAIRRQRAEVRRKARELADLPTDEFAARVARAFRQHPT